MNTITLGGKSISVTDEQLKQIEAITTPKVKKNRGYYLSSNDVIYTHYFLEDSYRVVVLSNTTQKYLYVLGGDSFATEEEAKAVDCDAIKRRWDIMARVESAYRKHLPEGWGYKAGERVYSLYRHSCGVGDYDIIITLYGIIFPFPNNSVGHSGMRAFISECGNELLDQYFEVRYGA